MASVNNPFEFFFDLVPTGAVLYAPIFDDSDELVDFRFVRLNPAGQRLLGLPAQPTRTFREQYPHSGPTGIFTQYRTAYLTGQAVTYDVPYEGDGLDTYFRLVAQRSDELLVVNFTDLADLPRSAVEQSLRESQAREQAARAEAERHRQLFHEVLMQLPAQVAVYHGPDHVYQFVNPPYQRVFPHRTFAGRPFREATPEAEELGVAALFDRVYQTGEPFYARELEGWFDFQGTGQREQIFFNLYLHPLHNPQGHVTGMLDFSYDVTEQVQARQQLEQLNQELEARVQERTQQLEMAQAEAERQRRRLERFFMQAPAAICVHDGPQLVFELVNPAYQQLFAGRQLMGKPLLEALPEVANLPAYHTTLQVYHTGQTYQARGLLTPLLQEDGTRQDRYFDLIQQARYDEQGRIDGVLVFAFEVTEQVTARRQAETLQAQVLAAAQRQATEREMFYQVFEQTPAAICIQRGPTHRFEYVNPAFQALFPDRVFVGHTPAEVLLETVEYGFVALLDRVYHTGETFRGMERLVVLENAAGEPGRTIYFNFTYQAYRENGAIVGISTFAYDVTEQVQTKQERE